MSEPAIEVAGLSKTFKVAMKDPGITGAFKALFRPSFRELTAVDGITFKVNKGESVGYIGVNGAGKSTSIKLFTGVLAPSSGTVRILGRDPHRERVANAQEIGVVFGQRTQLWWDLALIESLNLIAKIYGVPDTHYKKLLAQFTEDLDLGSLLHVPVRQMSLGQKMRAELAAALIHEPSVVFLDEPTIGLDVVVKEKIRAIVKEHNRHRGTTVVLTTHDLGDIEELCDRVMIIDGGKLIYDGDIETIKSRFGKHREIAFETLQPAPSFPVQAGTAVVKREPHKVVLRFDRTRMSASQVASIVMQNVEVTDFTLSEPDLASVVKQVYRGALREPRQSATPEIVETPDL